MVIETQRVKGFLFASHILRETRGASLLLDRLNRIETRKLLASAGATGGAAGEEIYLGGGSGRVLFPARAAADAFADAVRELYRSETWDARVSVEVVERGDESFPAWVARGVGESKKSKLARFEAVPLLGGRWLRPCSSCGKEPAEHIPVKDVQGEHRLCRSCRRKRDEVRRFYLGVKRNYDRGEPMPRAVALRREWPDFVLTTLAEAVESRFGAEVRTLLPKDFDDIGQVARPRNYFALIYADGNRMGETIRQMADRFPGDGEARQAYAAFSAIVDRATREAAVQAVLEVVTTEPERTREGEPGRFVPAELVVAGGDDLILVVPAQAALEVAERFVSRFAERSRELQDAWVAAGTLARRFAPDGLTTSAGVVLAHAAYPASQLVAMAADLMKLAKRRAADLGQGTIDFMVMHEGGSEEVGRRRGGEQQGGEYEAALPSGGGTLRRTERPYTAAGLGELVAAIRALKASQVPRGKLKALYAALFRSPVAAQFEALRIRERLQATGELEAGSPLRRLFAPLDVFPFRTGARGDWSTPLSELVEVFDFVQAPAGAVEAPMPAAAAAAGAPAAPPGAAAEPGHA